MTRMMGTWGGLMAAGTGTSQSRDAGLPFSGIPEELAKGVQDLLEKEPEPPETPVNFSQSEADQRPLTLRRLFSPYAVALFVAFILVIIQTVAMQIGPLLTQIGIDDGIMKKDLSILLYISFGYMGAIVLNYITLYARIAWTGRLGEQLMKSLRIRVFSHFQRLSINFYTEEMSGRLMTRMTSDIESLTALLQDGIVNLMVQGLTMVFVIGVLFTLNVPLAAVTVLFVTPLMLVLTLWFRKVSDRGYGVVRDKIANLLADFQENLTGIRVITAFNRQTRNITEHLNIAGSYKDANLYTAKVGAVFDSGSTVVAVIGQALIIMVGGRMCLNGTLTIGELTAFVLYLTTFFAPIQQLVQLYNTYQSGQAAIAKLRDLLGTQPSVPEAPEAKKLPDIQGKIVFKDVNFAYQAGQPILKKVDLVVQPGETFAFVGETGAGKSTMAKLIIRFYDPDSGTIELDGTNIKDITLKSLRTQFGYVPQEPFLFSGSIRDNISFAAPNSTDEEVMAACQAVGIDDLIEQMPHGIHTPVHERGSSLSSGERQLIALARAFLAKPRVILLDEATSNLDLASESRIEHALDVLLEGRTAIIIAHRLNTAMKADRIAVFHDGRVVELGHHQELVETGGLYSQMFEKWMKHADNTNEDEPSESK